MQYHVKDKAATSAIPSHGKYMAATGTMRPKHVFVDENIAHAQLNKDVSLRPQLRADEMAAGVGCEVSQKHLGKERSSASGMCLRGEMSRKQREKVDTGSIPKKHGAKEKMFSPDQLHRRMRGIQGDVKLIEGHVVGQKKQHTRSNNPKEKICPPYRLHQHTKGIQSPVSMAEAPVAGEKKQHTRSNNSKEKMCPPDQLCQLPRGIQGPISMTKARVAGERKQHTRSSTSLPKKRTTPQLKTQTGSHCSNASTSCSVDHRDGGNTAAAQEQRQSAAIKIAKDMEDIMQKLNELSLGEDISFEEYYGYLTQLPTKPLIDTRIKLDPMDYYDMEIRHAVYRINAYKLSQNVSKNELCRDELEGCPVDLLKEEEFSPDFLMEMEFFNFFEKVGIFDWFFDPKLCQIAGLNDYQRLVPRNDGEYNDWEVYRRYFHSYEVEYEYIEYFETLLRELKWLKDCLPIIRTASPLAGKICTRGIYQATKIATRFSKITSYFTHFGFYECFTYMSIEATWCDEANGLFFEIWKRVTQEKESLRDAVKEVYKLNKFLSRQDFLKYAVEEDDLTILEKGFQTCMRGITKDVSALSEDEAREVIAEAVKTQRIKPKFYNDYIRKKMDICSSIGIEDDGELRSWLQELPFVQDVFL